MVSVIIPAYNEQQTIPLAADAIERVLGKTIPYELIFVDDGSADDTWECIRCQSQRNSRVSGIHFSRNFGKDSAILAGLKYAKGDCCVIMDCDLQHPPETILDMVRLWEQGYEVVEGVKEDRGEERKTHELASRLFYRLISKAMGVDMRGSSDFKLLDRSVVDTLNSMPEQNAFFRALSYWVGYRRTSVAYRVKERAAGESKWSVGALIRYALKNIASFSTAPLHIVTMLGYLMLIVSVVFGTVALCQKFNGTALGGFTTVIIIQLFSSSILMISLGIIGSYIAKIYQECQRRPRYVVAKTCHMEGEIVSEIGSEDNKKLCGGEKTS